MANNKAGLPADTHSEENNELLAKVKEVFESDGEVQTDSEWQQRVSDLEEVAKFIGDWSIFELGTWRDYSAPKHIITIHGVSYRFVA